MLQQRSDIDETVTLAKQLMDRVSDEYKSLKVNPIDDYSKAAVKISFQIGYDYFKGAKTELSDGNLLSGTNLLRSSIENVADLLFIFSDSKKSSVRAQKYVESADKLTGAIVAAKLLGLDKTAANRILKQSNKWTTSTIDDRLKFIGKGMITTYDLMSYFSHPNPAATTYLNNPRLLEQQTNLVKQANCINVVTLLHLVHNHSDIKTVSLEEINQIGLNIGIDFSYPKGM